jgi:hypothetical protein
METIGIPKAWLENPRLKTGFAIGYKIERNDLEGLRLDHNELLNAVISLHETLAQSGIKFIEWKRYSDTLMTKFFLHTTSLERVLGGTEISFTALQKNKPSRKILDTPTANVIHRAQLETFLMHHFIYMNPSTDDEKYFRYLIWMYSFLIQRQKLPASEGFALRQKEADKVEMDELKKLIIENTYFKYIPEGHQKRILEKGEEKAGKTWVDLMNEIGFTENHMFSRSLYHFLSSYAHSGGLSLVQLKDARLGYSTSNKDASFIMYCSSVLIAFMITSIKKVYPVLELQYNMLSEGVRNKIEIYALMAQTPIHEKKK